MTAKETTLNELGEMLGHVVASMSTKDDIAGIMDELADIKLRLNAIEPMVEDHAGHSKEIDHALERISAIEKHIGMKPKMAT